MPPASATQSDAPDGAASERRGADTQQRLLKAIVDAVFEYGYAGATMARIARLAGVTRGAIQHHFGDRRVDMIAKACEYIVHNRQLAYRDHADFSQHEATTREAMKAAYRDPETWFLVEVWIASKSDPDMRARVSEILRNVNDPLDAEIAFKANAVERYGVDFRIIKYFFRSLTRGLAVEYSRKPDDALFDAVVDFAVDMLALKGRSKP